MSGCTHRIVTSVPEWETLRSCWDRLLHESEDSTPWQSWDYLSAWWRHLGVKHRLRIVVVERDGQPVLIFPLQLARSSMLGLPVRLLEPVSMLWDVNRPRFALGRGDAEAWRCGLDAIWSLRGEWDAIRVEELPLADPQAEALSAFAVERNLWFRHVLSSVCPWLSLEQSWPEFLKARSSRMRKNLRAALRRLEGFGPVGVDSYDTPEEISTGIAIMRELHLRSWKHKKRVGLSQSDAYRTFFTTFAGAMAERDKARVLVLRAGGRPVAATVGFTHGDTYFSTEIVHDEAFKECSPGTLLESFELQRLMEEGKHRAYDFLGRFLSNKQRWTEQARVTHRFYLFQGSLLTAVLEFHYFRAKPAVKRLWRAAFGLSRPTRQAEQFVRRRWRALSGGAAWPDRVPD